jgi:hypothetical protein
MIILSGYVKQNTIMPTLTDTDPQSVCEHLDGQDFFNNHLHWNFEASHCLRCFAIRLLGILLLEHETELIEYYESKAIQ